jgi:glucokinase
MTENELILAGDIGGTKTRLALFSLADGKLKTEAEASFASQQYSGLEPVIQEFLRGAHTSAIQSACFGVAGPVLAGTVKTPNLPWFIEAVRLADVLKTPAVALLNDLQAAALGIFTLEADEFLPLNAGGAPRPANKALIAAGTGLGEAVLYDDGRQYHPIASEAGHADFAPRDDLEIELLRFLTRKFGRVSYERVISGPGIFNIYEFLRDTRQVQEPSWFAEKLAASDDPSALISRTALAGEAEICVKALDMFVSAYGAEAGNLALRSKAIDGIYVGGGIAPKIRSKLGAGGFMNAFVEKGRYKDFVSAIPVYLVLNERTALRGAAYHAAFNSRG